MTGVIVSCTLTSFVGLTLTDLALGGLHPVLLGVTAVLGLALSRMLYVAAARERRTGLSRWSQRLERLD